MECKVCGSIISYNNLFLNIFYPICNCCKKKFQYDLNIEKYPKLNIINFDIYVNNKNKIEEYSNYLFEVIKIFKIFKIFKRRKIKFIILFNTEQIINFEGYHTFLIKFDINCCRNFGYL